MGECKIHPVPAHGFMAIWPFVVGAFNSFAERCFSTTVESLVQDILAEKRQCWIAVKGEEVKACALTKVGRGEEAVVDMTHCFGKDREMWQEDLVETIRAWAVELGAKRFRTYSRTGWTPLLKSMGLRETHRIMEQDIG